MKKLILFLPLFISSILSHAQFADIIDLCEEISTYDPQLIDIDEDGDLDVLTGAYWIENLGDGNFEEQQELIILENEPIDLYYVDLDSDGDYDLISRHWESLRWYENLGNGIFAAEESLIEGEAIHGQLRFADIDGDGDVDVYKKKYFGGDYIWFENLGDGNFASDEPIGTYDSDNIFVPLIEAADLDGDGDMELILATYAFGLEPTDEIVYFENLGNGLFSEAVTVQSDMHRVEGMEFEDINGDGNLDIIARSNGHNITWHENTGGAGFEMHQVIPIEELSPISFYVSDLDQDGDFDVLYTITNGDDILWSENLGNGSFVHEPLISTGSNENYEVLVGDSDGDGDSDVIVIGTGVIIWAENGGDLNFDEQHIISADDCRDGRVVATADLNGDGNPDVLSGTRNDKKIAWYENLGDGTFGAQQVISTNTDCRKSLFPLDLDGDGDMDVLALSRTTFNIVWFENMGEGSFSDEQVLITPLNGYLSAIYPADLDGDGDLDIVCAGTGTDKLVWFENLGELNFGQGQLINSDFINPEQVYATDLSNNGYPDVLCASRVFGVKLALHENLGNGTFDEQQVLSTDITAYSISSADLDGDGDVDLVVAYSGALGIVWYENLGEGELAEPQSFSQNAELGATASHIADLNNDGWPDVVAGQAANNSIVWYENYGDGSFGPEQAIFSGVHPGGSVTTFDYDGDGDLDVAGTFWHKSRIGVFENFHYHRRRISGNLYYDVNLNGTRDSADVGLHLAGVYSVPQSDYTFTDSLGNYSMFFSDVPGSYQIFPEDLPGWDLVSDSLSYTVLLDSNEFNLDSLDFGFYPEPSPPPHIQVSLTGGFPRCNFQVLYTIKLQNMVSNNASGHVELHLDSLITFNSSFISPDSVIGQKVYWDFENLGPFAIKYIPLTVQMPSFTAMGETMTSVLTVRQQDEAGEVVYTNSDTLSQVLVCAYDPNDKSVSPAGLGPEGYIPLNQEPEYLVRFQNTGTDTAFTVVIRDQLHENLNWGSLHPIASSHPMHVHVEQTGEAIFTFENIMLPDSNVNVLGSQGFVKFRVTPNEGLLPNTPIQNTAHIYFDMNPPIITNTVLNTIECYATPQPQVNFDDPYLTAGVAGDFAYQWYLNGSEIPGANAEIFEPEAEGLYSVSVTDSYNCTKLSEEYFHFLVGVDRSEQIKALVYPNPFTESTTVIFSQNLKGDYDLLISNVHGIEVNRINKLHGNGLTLRKSEIGTGVFLCFLTNTRTGETIFIEKLIIQ